VNSDANPPALVARILLSYDGSDFHGWQVQPGGLRTVQGELVRALTDLVPFEGVPPGAGRTDAGVHAQGQVASLPLVEADHLRRLQRALPGRMPPDCVVREVSAAAPDFHARFSATGRIYRYRFTRERDPFLRRNHLWVDDRVDFGPMSAACAGLVGDQDGTSLCRTASLEEGRTLIRFRRAAITEIESGAVFEVEADRFLHSTVRIIVGTLMEIGRGQRPGDDFARILAAKNRRVAGRTAPPHGLTLHRVLYDAKPEHP
jgi:tRNA pseudouridine38-40 synthase